ncbi:STOREKEEPER protein-like isoform X2 [Lycium barbarum]|uniref:STOREKEEPER protein-like isoform X2 n=1 Tax=Lycium barbarum TaxID=112863 RepID=UPI00293E0BB9|nr:STOREKEEPER protein-like isoform X2 [Lycium barbarum]
MTKTISKSPETTHSRVFTENDEIQLLKTLLKSPNNSSGLPDSNLTKTQIAKKVKRLKEKYHKFARSKSLIKTPHDGKIYEIGRKIWGRNAAKEKELHEKELHEKELHENHEVSEEERAIEIENVNLDDFPFLVNEMTTNFQRNDYFKEGLRRLGKEKLKGMNEKWMELKLEESELMVNKVQLYHEHLKLVVEGSKGSSSNE